MKYTFAVAFTYIFLSMILVNFGVVNITPQVNSLNTYINNWFNFNGYASISFISSLSFASCDWNPANWAGCVYNGFVALGNVFVLIGNAFIYIANGFYFAGQFLWYFFMIIGTILSIVFGIFAFFFTNPFMLPVSLVLTLLLVYDLLNFIRGRQ